MPHQITAVYEAMLPRCQLFLLAYDPGQNDHGRPADEGADRARRWRCARKARNVLAKQRMGAPVAGVTTYAPLLLPFKSRPYSAWRLSIAGPPLVLEAASSH